jgi:hypothetical protein
MNDYIVGSYVPNPLSDPDASFLHVGAQFYGVVDTGTQADMGSSTVATRSPYHLSPQVTTSNLAPMERYQQQTITEEPFGYMSTDAHEEALANVI